MPGCRTRWQPDNRSLGLDSLAGLVAEQDAVEAERLYREALAIDERLAKADPAICQGARRCSGACAYPPVGAGVM